MASVLQDQQRHREAIAQAQIALTEVELFASPEHPYSASAHQILATNHLRIEEYDAAERHARESFRLWKLNDFEPERLAWAASTLGEIFLRQGKLREAREQLTYAARNLQSDAAHRHRSAKRENDERIALLNEAMAKQKS